MDIDQELCAGLQRVRKSGELVALSRLVVQDLLLRGAVSAMFRNPSASVA
jgi:hypothetical protein